MVQGWFTFTETVRHVRTESPGRLPRFSHSSWTLTLGCFYSHISNHTFRRALTASEDSGVTQPGRVWRKVPESDAWSVGRWLWQLWWTRTLQPRLAVCVTCCHCQCILACYLMQISHTRQSCSSILQHASALNETRAEMYEEKIAPLIPFIFWRVTQWIGLYAFKNYRFTASLTLFWKKNRTLWLIGIWGFPPLIEFARHTCWSKQTDGFPLSMFVSVLSVCLLLERCVNPQNVLTLCVV